MDFSNLPLEAVKSRIYDKPENINYLREFFGSKNALPNFEAGQYLTQENLEAYQELAQRVINAGKDSTGVQARRIRQIISYLEGTRDVT